MAADGASAVISEYCKLRVRHFRATPSNITEVDRNPHGNHFRGVVRRATASDFGNTAVSVAEVGPSDPMARSAPFEGVYHARGAPGRKKKGKEKKREKEEKKRGEERRKTTT